MIPDAGAYARLGLPWTSAAERVAEAQAALQLAESELVEQQEALLHKGQRALAYARVFAEDSPELMEKLQLVSLPRSLRRAKAEPASPGADVIPVRRRGRPPKPKNEAPNLFEEEMPVELGSTG